MAVTLADISRHVSLTPASVSKILAGYPGFSEQTRQRVIQTAQEMGYRPNLAARGLLQKKSLLLGVMDRKCNSGSFVNYLEGIQSVCVDRHYAPLVFTHDTPQEQDANLQLCQDRHVDGLLVTLHLDRQDVVHLGQIKALVKRGFPIVEVHGKLLPEVPSVRFDYHAAGVLAVEHLLSLGHRRIAIFPDEEEAAHRPVAFWYRNQYVAGCIEGLKRVGLSPVMLDRPICIRERNCSQWAQAAKDTVDRLLQCEPRPTAVVTMGETETVGIYHALCERGVSTPGDLSLVGYTAGLISELLPQIVTTIRHDAAGVGRQAASMVFDLIDGKEVKDILTPPQVLMGQSTAKLVSV